MSSPQDDRALRAASKTFFGQEHRLNVMLAIAGNPSGTFTLSEVAAAVGVNNVSSIQGSLAALVELGLITRDEESANSRIRPFTRTDKSAAWRFAEELRDRVLRSVPGTLPLG